MSLVRAFSSIGCPALSLDDTLAVAVKHGVAAVELRALGGTTDLPAWFARNFGSPAGLAKHLQASPVQIVGLDTSFKLIGPTGAERAAFLQFLPWAEALGVPRLRVFDGGRTADDAELAQAAETMHWWQALRRERGWRTDLMVETHDSLFTAAAIRRFLAVAPGAAILWDTHHTWKRGGEDPVVTWRAIKPHVVHIHVKDSVSKPSSRHPYSYVLPGDGEFPMKPLREVLQAEYSGPLSLEGEVIWHPYLPPLDGALATAVGRGWW